jgi:hypothetical protein
MSFSTPVRSVCRGWSRRLLDDCSGANPRAFSQMHRKSYPRTRPVGGAAMRLQPVAVKSEELGKKTPLPKADVVESLDNVVRLAELVDGDLSANTSRLGELLDIRGTGESDSVEPMKVEEPRKLSESTKTLATSQEESSTPWYLQSQHAVTKPAPPEHLLERQRIPGIPENAPAILQQILQYVSTDLGVDYLTLLDLRSLDPPAALGANLIMVVGTARGEKHLHVSADRLCRWLRSNHKLRPTADGLLGRNELKIKLRRKAKRMKVLAHVGSIDAPGVDDGLRTGWVCVNISGVKTEGAEGKEAEHVEHGFVGFGESSADTTIIVHMLVEEKREELDLETLWNNRLKRRKIKAAEDGVVWGNFSRDLQPEGRELIG